MKKKEQYIRKILKNQEKNYSYNTDFLQKFFEKNPIEYSKIWNLNAQKPYYRTLPADDGSTMPVITGILLLPFYENKAENSGIITYHHLRILVNEHTFELYKNNVKNPTFDGIKTGLLLSDVAWYKGNFLLNVHLVFDKWNPFPYIYENKDFETEHKRRGFDQKLLENMKNGINKKQLFLYFRILKQSQKVQEKLKNFKKKILSF